MGPLINTEVITKGKFSDNAFRLLHNYQIEPRINNRQNVYQMGIRTYDVASCRRTTNTTYFLIQEFTFLFYWYWLAFEIIFCLTNIPVLFITAWTTVLFSLKIPVNYPNLLFFLFLCHTISSGFPPLCHTRLSAWSLYYDKHKYHLLMISMIKS